MNLLDIIRDFVAQVPELIQPLIVAVAGAVPFVEGEGAAVIGIIGDIHPVTAIIAGIVGGRILFWQAPAIIGWTVMIGLILTGVISVAR